MADDGDVFLGEMFDAVHASRAVDAVRALLQHVAGPTQVVVGRSGLEVRPAGECEEGRCNLAIARMSDEFGRSGCEVDACGLGGRSLIDGEDAQHRQLAFALQGCEICNSETASGHGVTLVRGSDGPGRDTFWCVTPALRADLSEAHARAWRSLSSPGTWWSARERRSFAQTAIRAMWSGGDQLDGIDADGPEAAHRAVARLAKGSSDVSREWYEEVRNEIGALQYVELVGLVCVVAATTSLRHSLGMPLDELLPASDEAATRAEPPTLEDAKLNWVPVAAPADATAAVVQALTAVPKTNDDLWSLADVQYIPEQEMIDPRWTRGTLSRVEMELVATRVSFSRECHY